MSRIITFYSYKGGVGRTFALANIGVLLANQGKRVLLMDWDLEAPGLHRYFKPHLRKKAQRKQGLIHLLSEAATNAEAQWQPYVSEMTIKNGPTLSLLTSGDQAADYADRVSGFSWGPFFAEHGGKVLDRWREEWKRDYDFVLIDSRTGITDTGGVCTVFLPDILVLVFAANEQSFEQGIRVVEGVQKARQGLAVPRPAVSVLPLPGRFDGRDEIKKAAEWLERFAKDLKPFYDSWLPERFTARQMLEVTKVPYISLFSFGEPLPVVTHSITDPELPGYYLNNAARLLASSFRDAAQILEPEGPAENKRIAALRLKLEETPLDEFAIQKEVEALREVLGEGAVFINLLDEVGVAFSRQRQFTVAEQYYRRAIRLAELNKEGGAITILSDLYFRLGNLMRDTLRWQEAEYFLRQALVTDEANLGLDHPDVAMRLNNLAQLLQATNRLTDAEPLMRRALNIDEASFGPNHPDVARDLNNLAQLLQASNRLTEAEPMMRRVASILESIYGTQHPILATAINNLALLLQTTNRLAEAELLMRRALAIDEASFGPNHPEVAIDLNNLAALLEATNRLTEAEKSMRSALLTFLHSHGWEHPSTQTVADNYLDLIQQMGLSEEAAMTRIRAILASEAVPPLEPASPSGDNER